MVRIVNSITLKAAFGEGGGNKDESANLDDMNIYERFIYDIEILKTLQGFSVLRKNGRELEGDAMIIDPSDDLKYDGGTVGGACHGLNKVFVVLRKPYFAFAFSENGKVIKSKNRETGVEKDKTVAELIRVNRITKEFDVSKYACLEANKKNKKGNDILKYEEPTEGMRLRKDAWFTLHHDELIENGIIEE